MDVVLDGLKFPEGPRWYDGRLYFSDMWAGRVMSLDANGQTSVLAELPETRPSGIGFTPDGRVLVVSMTDRKLMVIDRHLGLREVADFSHLAPGPANDMVTDSQGRSYIGNFGFDFSGGAPFEPTVLVRVDPDGSCRVVAEDLAFPNGAVITPDESALIVAETFAQRLTAFDILPDGTLVNRRVWAQMTKGHPDGICFNPDGAIWVASPTTRECVLIREGGEVVRRIEMREGRGAYACALSGENGTTLYICTAEGDEQDRVAGRSRGWIEAIDVRTVRPLLWSKREVESGTLWRMVNLHVNGEQREAPHPRRNLLSYLRFDLGLTGTKYGCGEGLCGACTVLVDGQAIRSCLATVGSVAGGEVTTIEGLAKDGRLHPVQQEFLEQSAMQCGYCIPGFIMSSVALLARNPRPDSGQVREALSENMCRCGTYPRIERAVLKAGGAE